GLGIGGSGFAGSNLDTYLRNQDIKRIYLACFALHVCILATLIQEYDLGYQVAVLEDACPAFTEDQRKALSITLAKASPWTARRAQRI
ncbi:MAG: isochorismatase family protein, partial [Thermodesulfobacteriota bacterium]